MPPDRRSPDLWSDHKWCLSEGAITYAVVTETNQLPSIYSLVTRRESDPLWSLLLLEHLAGPPTSKRVGTALCRLRDGVWVPPRDVFPTMDAALERANDMIAERYNELAKMLSMSHTGSHTLEFTLPRGLTLIVHYDDRTVRIQSDEGALTITSSGEVEHEQSH